MTVKLTAQWGGQPPGSLFTADPLTEAALVSAGQAVPVVRLPAGLAAPVAMPAGYAAAPFAWYDASQQPVVADGTALASVVDNSGNGWTISQATAGKRPQYKVAANWGGGGTGKPALRFDGSDDVLVTPWTTRQLGVQHTIFIVFSFRVLTATSGARECRLLSAENKRWDGSWYVGTSTATIGGGGTSCVKVSNFEAASYSTSPVAAIATPYIVSIVSGAQLFVDGVRASQATALGVLPEMTQKYAGLCIGNIDDGLGQALQGEIAELLFYARQLTDAERQATEAALAAKYNLAAPTVAATVR